MAGPGKYGGFDPSPDEAVPEPAPGVVDLVERNLAEFPAVTKALRAAVEINLEGNELVSVPTGVLSRLTRLETLRLTGCALTYLPEDLGRCESIARLFAGANRITDASPAFELPCAVHVGLSHNRVGALHVVRLLGPRHVPTVAFKCGFIPTGSSHNRSRDP